MKTKEEQKEYRRKWRLLNKEKANEWERKYYHSHKEEISLKNKNKLKLFRLTHPKKERPKMENHPSWKGGIINANGYRLIRQPNHKRNWNGYVQEHILIMEKHLGRELQFFGKSNPNNEIVHHKNEDTINNSLNNLQLMKHQEHLNFHHNKNGT
jgi:hypothetical protein